MRIERLSIIALGVVVYFAAAQLVFPQQDRRSASQLDCVEKLVIPRYSAVARMARLSGTAQVVLEVDPEGLPAKLQVEGVHGLLDRQVRKAVMRSRFVPSCAGQRIELQFVFTLTEESSYFPRTTVEFSPPARFEVKVTKPEMNP